MRRFFVCLMFVIAICFLPVGASARDSESYSTAAQALASCQNLSWINRYSTKWNKPECHGGSGVKQSNGKYLVAEGWGIYKANGQLQHLIDFYSTGVSCPAGKPVPIGSSYKFYPYGDAVGPHDGVACVDGCEMTTIFDPRLGMSHALTGAVCPAHTGDEPTPVPVPPDPPPTPTPDGGTSWCDTISGKCVTSGGGSGPTAPASSSSSSNSSTSSSTTGSATTGATSSDSTTTSSSTTTTTTSTTNTGGGTGTGGDGTGSTGTTGTGTSVSSGTSSTHTDVPASSSSTASDTKCTTGVCDVGNADGNIGDLYQSGTVTADSLYGEFKDSVSSSPFIGAAQGFFTVSVSGSCPAWHIPGNKYWGPDGFDFDFFCSPGMLELLTLAGYIVLAVGAFCAFRIALY